MAMGCSEVLERLSSFLDGSLDRDSAVQVEAHLAHCAECRREREGIEKFDELWRSLPPDALGEPTWQDVDRPHLSDEELAAVVSGGQDRVELLGRERWAHLVECSECMRTAAWLRRRLMASPEESAPEVSVRFEDVMRRIAAREGAGPAGAPEGAVEDLGHAPAADSQLALPGRVGPGGRVVALVRDLLAGPRWATARAVVFVAVLIVAVTTVATTQALRQKERATRAAGAFWASIRDDERPILLVRGRAPVFLPDDSARAAAGDIRALTGADFRRDSSFIGVGDADALSDVQAMLSRLLDPKQQDRILERGPDELDLGFSGIMVFIGGPSVNRPALELVAERLGVPPDGSPVTRGYRVVLHRRSGADTNAFVRRGDTDQGGVESADGRQFFPSEGSLDYGILFDVRSFEGPGPRRAVWFLGYESPGSLAAARFVSGRGVQRELDELCRFTEERIRELRRSRPRSIVVEAVIRAERDELGDWAPSLVPNTMIAITADSPSPGR